MTIRSANFHFWHPWLENKNWKLKFIFRVNRKTKIEIHFPRKSGNENWNSFSKEIGKWKMKLTDSNFIFHNSSENSWHLGTRIVLAWGWIWTNIPLGHSWKFHLVLVRYTLAGKWTVQFKASQQMLYKCMSHASVTWRYSILSLLPVPNTHTHTHTHTHTTTWNENDLSRISQSQVQTAHVCYHATQNHEKKLIIQKSKL